MNFLDKNSLFNTVDSVSEAFLFNIEINADERNDIADFIINQQGKPKTYANTFALTEQDLDRDLIIFTGEKIKANAGKCHMIGEEASRILRLLDLRNDKINSAIKNSDTGLQNRISNSYPLLFLFICQPFLMFIYISNCPRHFNILLTFSLYI